MATLIPKAAKKPGGEGFYVKCPGCGGFFHETTEWFDSTRTANGTMFKLLPMYGPSGANWQSFPFQEEVTFESLYCPGCGSSYTQGGSFVKVEPASEHFDVDAPAIDRELHLDYKDMVDQGLFVPVSDETSNEAK